MQGGDAARIKGVIHTHITMPTVYCIDRTTQWETDRANGHLAGPIGTLIH